MAQLAAHILAFRWRQLGQVRRAVSNRGPTRLATTPPTVGDSSCWLGSPWPWLLSAPSLLDPCGVRNHSATQVRRITKQRPTLDQARGRSRPMAPEFAHIPTPLEPAPRLAQALGLDPDRFFVKRDDCTGVAVGGNKIRKLERLVAQARREGLDTLVTGGGTQSNHARSTAGVAARVGMKCVLVLAGPEPQPPTSNVLLDRLFGAEIRWIEGPLAHEVAEQAVLDTAAELDERHGRSALAIPLGGSSGEGVAAYAEAAGEISGQLRRAPEIVITASGTGGTQAGLTLGFGPSTQVIGVNVGARPDLEDALPRLAEAGHAVAAIDQAPSLANPEELKFDLRHGFIGARYAAITPAASEAAGLFARTAGLVLDPVYTAKAAAGLVSMCQAGEITADQTVVFMHTGGLPGLFVPDVAGFGLPDL